MRDIRVPYVASFAFVLVATDEGSICFKGGSKICQAAVAGLGIANRTVFIFSSDNGGASSHTTNYPLRHGKGSLLEGGLRVPLAFAWSVHENFYRSCR